MAKDKKESAEGKSRSPQAARSGAGQKRPSSDKGQERSKKKTSSYKHVNVERKRPQLTRDGSAQGKKETRRADARRSFSSSRKDPRSELRIIPLGGLDAIGKNMTAFECDGDMILDDAGLMFPDDDHPGIDLILPDYTYVLENADKLRGIVITHGHEDHTGSLPYLLKDLDRTVPIYATKLTLGLIEGKFAEHRVKNAKLIESNPGTK